MLYMFGENKIAEGLYNSFSQKRVNSLLYSHNHRNKIIQTIARHRKIYRQMRSSRLAVSRHCCGAVMGVGIGTGGT